MADTSRITIRETADGLGIYNPTRRNLPVALFLLVWLTGWAAGEAFVLYTLFTGDAGFADLFLVVWVTFWTIGGFFAISAVLWQLIGVEKLFVTGGAMVRELGFWSLTRRRVWALDSVANIRAEAPPGKDAGSIFSRGGIVFEVDGATKSFGIQLDEAERMAALEAVHRYVPAGNAERQALAETIGKITRIKQAGGPAAGKPQTPV